MALVNGYRRTLILSIIIASNRSNEFLVRDDPTTTYSLPLILKPSFLQVYRLFFPPKPHQSASAIPASHPPAMRPDCAHGRGGADGPAMAGASDDLLQSGRRAGRKGDGKRSQKGGERGRQKGGGGGRRSQKGRKCRTRRAEGGSQNGDGKAEQGGWGSQKESQKGEPKGGRKM